MKWKKRIFESEKIVSAFSELLTEGTHENKQHIIVYTKAYYPAFNIYGLALRNL